jgi:hypothetical protein
MRIGRRRSMDEGERWIVKAIARRAEEGLPGIKEWV